ncbi:hypothetical protein F5Y07DRAFT_371249 [Xylaria sp. FL0933]|nr:hypothetical protein F5Y07DRAFT_371249 [Xylaria sp. FL0933]
MPLLSGSSLDPVFPSLGSCEMSRADNEAASESLEYLDWSSYGFPPVSPNLVFYKDCCINNSAQL